MPGSMIVMRCPVGYRQTSSGTNFGTQMAAVSQSYLDKRELIELVERRSVLPNALPEQLEMKVDQDKPILRVYPYSDGLVVCRTNRVRNRLDDERACLFSCSLVFNTSEADAVLCSPFGFTDPGNYDQYAACCERIRNAKDSRLTTNDTLGLALLQQRADADVQAGAGILHGCGFDQRSLELYIQGLLLCAEDQTRRLVVILPREVREDWHSGDLSEQLICESYLMLLPRHRKNMGFISHWAGGLSGEHVAGMQVCFFHPSGDGKDLRELKQSGCMILDLENHSSANLQLTTPGIVRLLMNAALEADNLSCAADFDRRVQELFQASDKLSARRMEVLLDLFALQDSPQGDGPEREAAVAAVIASFGKNAILNRSGYRAMLHREIDQLIQRGRIPTGQQLSALQIWMRNGDSSQKQLDTLYRMLLSAVYTGEDQPEAATELLKMAKEEQGYAQIFLDFCQEEHSDLLATMGKSSCDVQFFSLVKTVSGDHSGFSEELRKVARRFMDISIVTAMENKMWDLIPSWLERTEEFLSRNDRQTDGSLQTVYKILFRLEHCEVDGEIQTKAAEQLRDEPARAEKLGRLELFYKTFLLQLAELIQEKKAPASVELDLLLELSCMDVNPVAPLFRAYSCFLRSREMTGQQKIHDFSSTVERLAETSDETRYLRLCTNIAKLEMIRFHELPDYVQHKEPVLPLLKRFKSATGLEESSFKPIFDYISEYAQRQVDFRWDKLAVVLARANLLLFFYIYSEEQHLPSVDTLESQINKTSSTRRLLLYSANRREGEAKRKLLEIERRWFSQAVDRIGDLEEWVDALQKEQSITVGCNETVINFVDVAVQKEYKNRFSRREDLSEIPPDLLRRLGSLGSAVHADAQFREYVPMIELDRYWDDQAANRMEKLWEDSEHSGQRNLLEKRINYRLKNDFGDNSICAVTALMLLSLDQNNQVNESTFLERLIRRYPDDGDRLRVAFYVLNQPELNTLRNAEQVSKIMHSYLLRTARENRDVFCTPGTTQLSQPLANELSLMQVQCESQYLELSKILSGAGIRLDASRHGDRGLKKSMLGGHVLILILAFVCALLVVGMVGYCACFLLPERISVIGLLILILVALIQQLIVLIVRLLRSN